MDSDIDFDISDAIVITACFHVTTGTFFASACEWRGSAYVAVKLAMSCVDAMPSGRIADLHIDFAASSAFSGLYVTHAHIELDDLSASEFMTFEIASSGRTSILVLTLSVCVVQRYASIEIRDHMYDVCMMYVRIYLFL